MGELFEAEKKNPLSILQIYECIIVEQNVPQKRLIFKAITFHFQNPM